jgi:hypothetical protein
MRKIMFVAMGLVFAESGYAQLKQFPIRYVSSDVVYIQAGTAAGLKEGMHLNVRRPAPGQTALLAPAVAELLVVSVASTSAACEIVKTSVMLEPGDQVFVDATDLEEHKEAIAETEVYTQVVEFTSGNPLEEELRERVPKPPLREINRFGGRIGFEQDSIIDRSSLGQDSSQQGVTFRFDFTRIGNSHWNLGGYWRARVSARKRSVQNESLTDVMQRVYQFGLRYDNPQSRLVAGLGRLMVPWAGSLSTLDGGYLGIRVGKTVTVGTFAGTTPDPTAWNYDPRRQLGGVFANFERGSFERMRYTLTGGVALSRLDWNPERQFLFVENGMLLGRKISIHHNVEADYQSVDRFASTSKFSLTRSFATLRVQPISRLTLDLSHNYFRVLPTPDERLIVTQQLGNLLFRGLNAGARVELPYGLAVYANGGKASRSEDPEASWNGTGGVAIKVPKTGFRVEGRFSRYSGSVGAGDYRSVSLRRENSQRWRLELEGGDQRFDSPFAPDNRTWYGMGGGDIFFGRFSFGFRGTRYYGSTQKYDQLRGSVDFRF